MACAHPTLTFSAADHVYTLDGVPIVSVTQLLQRGNLINTSGFNDQAAQRGTDVHEACAAFDLGALDPATYQGPHQGYLAAHVKATQILKPEWAHIEVPFGSRRYRVAGRIDRAGRLYGAQALMDLKTGSPAPWHSIQTALYAVLLAEVVLIPPQEIHRYAEYLSRAGTFRIERFEDRRDFDVAYQLMARFAQ